MEPDTRILIVGAGAFGTSTAFHLAQKGYRNITVLDRYPVPSLEAASTDVSKVIRSDYNDPLYARLGLEAMLEWKSDTFKDICHFCGWIMAAKKLSVPFVEGALKVSQSLGVSGVERLRPAQIRDRFPVISGELEGWNINVWNPTAGWVDSSEAIRRMSVAAQAKGATYISGEDGDFKNAVFDSNGVCTGVTTRSGRVYLADRVILATGAWTPSLIDLSSQLAAKGHSVAHIQLTPQEAAHYAKMPILDNLELGYFFPPNKEDVLKVAHSNFVLNTKTDSLTGITTSIPHTFFQNPEDGLPVEIERAMRQNLRRVLPELCDRPFSYTRLCWDADTADRHFLVTKYPGHKNLFLAAGGSAHGFKFMPVIGRYIADMLEGKLEPEAARKWRWRAGEKLHEKDLAHQDPEVELGSLTGWKGRNSTLTSASKL